MALTPRSLLLIRSCHNHGIGPVGCVFARGVGGYCRLVPLRCDQSRLASTRAAQELHTAPSDTSGSVVTGHASSLLGETKHIPVHICSRPCPRSHRVIEASGCN